MGTYLAWPLQRRTRQRHLKSGARSYLHANSHTRCRRLLFRQYAVLLAPCMQLSTRSSRPCRVLCRPTSPAHAHRWLQWRIPRQARCRQTSAASRLIPCACWRPRAASSRPAGPAAHAPEGLPAHSCAEFATTPARPQPRARAACSKPRSPLGGAATAPAAGAAPYQRGSPSTPHCRRRHRCGLRSSDVSVRRHQLRVFNSHLPHSCGLQSGDARAHRRRLGMPGSHLLLCCRATRRSRQGPRRCR